MSEVMHLKYNEAYSIPTLFAETLGVSVYVATLLHNIAHKHPPPTSLLRSDLTNFNHFIANQSLTSFKRYKKLQKITNHLYINDSVRNKD